MQVCSVVREKTLETRELNAKVWNAGLIGFAEGDHAT